MADGGPTLETSVAVMAATVSGLDKKVDANHSVLTEQIRSGQASLLKEIERGYDAMKAALDAEARQRAQAIGDVTKALERIAGEMNEERKTRDDAVKRLHDRLDQHVKDDELRHEQIAQSIGASNSALSASVAATATELHALIDVRFGKLDGRIDDRFGTLDGQIGEKFGDLDTRLQPFEDRRKVFGSYTNLVRWAFNGGLLAAGATAAYLLSHVH